MGEDSNVAPNSSDVKIYVCTTDEYGKQDYKELDTVATSEIKAEREDAEQNGYSISMDVKSYYNRIVMSVGAEVNVRELAKAHIINLLQWQFARHKAKRAKMAKRRGLKFLKEWLQAFRELEMQGWGYTPKLHSSAHNPYRAKPYWHRTRSFCVSRGYH